MPKLTEEQKTNYLELALRLVDISAPLNVIEMTWKLFEVLQKKGGDLSVRDAIRIKYEVQEKYKEKPIRNDFRPNAVRYKRIKNG